MEVLKSIYFIGKDVLGVLKEGYKFISPKISYKKFEKNMDEKYVQPIQKLLDESDSQLAINTIEKILVEIEDFKKEIGAQLYSVDGKKALLLNGINALLETIWAVYYYDLVFIDTIDSYKDKKYDAEYRERLNRMKEVMQYWNDNKEEYLKNKIVLRFDKCNKKES